MKSPHRKHVPYASQPENWEEGDNEFIQSAAVYEGDEDDDEIEELQQRLGNKPWKEQRSKKF